MKVEFIGTGSIFATSNSASYLINDKILVDIPNGCCKALKRMNKDVIDVEYIFITHFHGDHFLDIPFLLSEIYARGSKKITLIGGVELEEKVYEAEVVVDVLVIDIDLVAALHPQRSLYDAVDVVAVSFCHFRGTVNEGVSGSHLAVCTFHSDGHRLLGILQKGTVKLQQGSEFRIQDRLILHVHRDSITIHRISSYLKYNTILNLLFLYVPIHFHSTNDCLK